MAFSTKKYTRPVLLNELRKLSVSNFTNLSTFANAFSPRAGIRSAKVAALTQFVTRTQLNSLFNNGGAANAKKSLIKIVKNS